MENTAKFFNTFQKSPENNRTALILSFKNQLFDARRSDRMKRLTNIATSAFRISNTRTISAIARTTTNDQCGF